MARKKLGELLIERNIITPAQLQEGLAYQRHWGHRLGAALVAKGFLTLEGRTRDRVYRPVPLEQVKERS